MLLNYLEMNEWKAQKNRHYELVHDQNRLVDKHNSFYEEDIDRV